MENPKRITFDKFIEDYNEYYHENLRIIRIDTHDIGEVFFNIYDSDDFEIDYDEEIIDIY